MTDWLFNDSLYTGCPRSGFYNSSHRRSRHLESIQNIFCLDATKWLQQQKPSMLALMDQFRPYSVNAALLLLSLTIIISGFATQYRSSSAHYPPGAFSPAGLLHQRDTRHNDELARQVSWSVMQPHITNESRNCGICRRADQTRLIFAPDLSLHYAAIIENFYLHVQRSSTFLHCPVDTQTSQVTGVQQRPRDILDRTKKSIRLEGSGISTNASGSD